MNVFQLTLEGDERENFPRAMKQSVAYLDAEGDVGRRSTGGPAKHHHRLRQFLLATGTPETSGKIRAGVHLTRSSALARNELLRKTHT